MSSSKKDTKDKNTKTKGTTSQLSGDVGKKYKLLVQILTSDPRFVIFISLLMIKDMPKLLQMSLEQQYMKN